MVVSDTSEFPGFLITPVLTQITFKSQQLLFSHASAEVRGKICQEEISPQLGHESGTLTTEPPGRAGKEWVNPFPHNDTF